MKRESVMGRELLRQAARKSAVAAIRQSGEEQSNFLAFLAGLCLLIGGIYCDTRWNIIPPPAGSVDGPELKAAMAFLQGAGMDPWFVAVLCSALPLLILAGYAGSDLRFERRWRARARRELRYLKRATLSDAKQFMKQRRRK
jgi:hypothetical protein